MRIGISRKTNNRELRACLRALGCEWVAHGDLVNQGEPVTGG